MDKIIKIFEEKLEAYVKSLEEAPVKTIIKTAIIIWLVIKIKRMLK